MVMTMLAETIETHDRFSVYFGQCSFQNNNFELQKVFSELGIRERTWKCTYIYCFTDLRPISTNNKIGKNRNSSEIKKAFFLFCYLNEFHDLQKHLN
jgi:hypothetical protein